MGREQKDIYCFISDEGKKFYKAIQQNSGEYSISFNSNPYPIKYNPANLLKCPVEFATNSSYMSMVRSISFPLDFIKDGAAILRHLYYNKKNIEQKCYLTIIEWDGTQGIYVLTYYGKIDLSEKFEDPKSGTFTVPVVDDSAWGVLSRNDTVQFAIDCSPSNPKAIPVLIDGTTLINRYTFQTVQAPIINNTADPRNVCPFVLINQDGDSAGIAAKSQTPVKYDAGSAYFPPDSYIPPDGTWCLYTAYAINNITIKGQYSFTSSINDPVNGPGGVWIYFLTSKGQLLSILKRLGPTLGGYVELGKIYLLDVDFTLNMVAGESLFLVVEMRSNSARNWTITPITTNIIVTTKTKSESIIAYGIRAIDLAKEILSKATRNRFTINSDFLTANNKDVCLSGDSIRGVPNAKIYTSFKDFFKTFDAIYFLALRVVNGNLFVEKATEVYKNSGVLIDLGEAIDVKLNPAKEYYCNEIIVGSTKQDYRHPSGRLEFNSENTFSLNFENISKKELVVSKYRLGCYDIIFLILDHKGGSTKDNTGDKSVYVVKITDDKATAIDDIETFENFTINNAPLQPIIKSPRNNHYTTYNKPTIRGISKPGDTVNIYVDTVLDGSTVADGNGNWSYNINTALQTYIPGVETGVHVIDATFSDLSAPVSTISLMVDTANTTNIEITYPSNSANLYNNKPLIKGTATHGTNIDISVDGVVVGSVVTDNSGLWEFKVVAPLANGARVISVNLGVSSVSFNVDSSVAYPLITYIGSELDGFAVINNMPLIEGVAIPGTLVTLWLNYVQYSQLGSAVADANGNWSFQVIPTSYIDPLLLIPVIIAPIRNGLSVLSTSIENHTVGIVVTGYKLSKPAYSSITGVIDNTIFNTEYSPKRMLLQRNPLWASMLNRMQQEKIYFQTADKNSNLRTVLGSVVVSESDDVLASSLGQPLFLLENAIIKVPTSNSFARTLYNFSNGGYFKVNFRGNDLYLLPIGNMKMSTIVSNVQEWRLLMAPTNSYQTLLNLYKNGLTINLMQNAIYHSDYNTLHFVTYNYQRNPKYNNSDYYDDWFTNRNNPWLYNPQYIQKMQRTDPFLVDQIITNGVSSVTLKMYDCKTGFLVDTKAYNAIAVPPIPPPDIVLEAKYDMSTYPEGQYFFVQFVNDTPVAISERIDLRDKWNGTILIEAGNSINMVGAFFSTGFKSIIRIEGIVKKFQPNVTSIVANEESGNSDMLYSQITKQRVIRFGHADGVPDYIYMRVAAALLLDSLFVEGVGYTIDENEKINKSEDIPGVPLYYYNVLMNLSTNKKGLTVEGTGGGIVDGVILVVDAEAFGLPQGSLINISVQ